MQINVYPKESNQIPAYLIAFLIHSNQVGVGILGFQRVIAKEAGHDAWISVAIAGIAVHLVVWVIFMTLSRYPSADLYGINRDVFGKWLGNLINLLYMIYFTMAAIVVLRSYTEVVQAWMFPEVSTWSLSAVILGLTLYTILGGIRVIGLHFYQSARDLLADHRPLLSIGVRKMVIFIPRAAGKNDGDSARIGFDEFDHHRL